jgi:hypothetical protein
MVMFRRFKAIAVEEIFFTVSHKGKIKGSLNKS